MAIFSIFDTMPDVASGHFGRTAGHLVTVAVLGLLGGFGCDGCGPASGVSEEPPADSTARASSEGDSQSSSSESSEEVPPKNGADRVESDGIRLLALGDSYTVGVGVSPDARWPSVLAETMRKRGRSVATPTLVATGGWTSQQLFRAMKQRSLSQPFEVAIVLIGTNDALSGWSTERFRTYLGRVLERAAEATGGRPERVAVCTIPDYSVTPVGREVGVDRARRRVEAFNEVIRSEADAEGARVVDLAPISKRIERDQALLADDLHPGSEIHRAWASRIRSTVASILGETADQ